MENIALPTGFQEENNKPLYEEINISNFTLINYLESASADLLSVPNYFENLPQSHINRKETKELFDWIFESKTEDKNNIAILAGNAGMGKSVVLKDLLVQLIENKTPVLGLKSDKKLLSVNSASIGKSILEIDADIKSVFDKLSKTNEAVVVLIDQIDALSQSLSTKRSQLTAYTSLINSLAHSKIDKIRIVISCRIYDLKHEAEFKQYRNKKEIILTELSDEEVGTVLKTRTGNKISYFPKELIKLLKTPLHLDIFCKIYSNSVSVQKIKTLQDLYRHLWEEKVYNNKNNCAFEAIQLEVTLFDIARKIELQKENLCAPISLFSSFFDEIKYLKSENLIVEKENDLQFFHQSFYDYTYARYFVEKGGNILDYINNCEHQGLFIRSKIKQVISYLRDYNSNLYISQIKEILLSDTIRYHIKLMIIETLAFEENPSIDECKLILDILNYNQSLSASFFNCIPKIKWLYFFNKKHTLIKLLNGVENQLNEAIRRFIVFSADKDPATSLQLLNQIKDKEQWGSYLRWAFFRVKDFSNPIVLEMYNNIHDEFIDHKGTDYHILENAIQSNLEFTISEARKIFLKELPEWKKERIRTAGHDRRESHFYEELYKAAPVKQTYLFFKEIITKLSDKADDYTFGDKYKLLNDDFLFLSYDPESYDEHKYVEWMIDWLNKNANIDIVFVNSEVNYFLQSNEALSVFIALRVIENNLHIFLPQAYSVLTNQDLTEDCLNCDDLKFRYRNILERAYPLLSSSERLFLNNFILSFYGGNDKYFNKGYYDERKQYPIFADKDDIVRHRCYPCPFAEYYKFLLLTSIPADILKKYQNLYIKEKILKRRFEDFGSTKNIKPNHSVLMGQSERGLVSPERYRHFTINQWYKSILKYDSDTFNHDRERHFSTSQHAKAFRNVIKENPDKFITFIDSIMLDSNIHIVYKVEAIEGLIEVKYDTIRLRHLFGLLMQNDIPIYYVSSTLRSSHYFIDISFIDDELINYWKECINKPFVPNKGTFHTPNEKQRNDVFFAEGCNTVNGEGLISIVNLLPLKSYQKYALDYLIEIQPALPIQLKLVVLYELNSICKYLPNEIVFELFKAYITEITSEIYYVSGQIISNLFDKYFTELIPFIRATIEMPLAAESLGIYLLYGWFYGHEDSKDLLFELHQLQPDSIKHTLTQAFRYCKNTKFKDKCYFILDYYVTNNNKEVRDSFSHGFHQLPESDFKQLKELILKHVNQLDDDRLHSLYSYLIKCARENAKECLEIQQVINEKYTIKESYHITDPIKLIIFCYNSIREYDLKSDEIEFAMDEFDKLLQKNQVNNELDSFLTELDK